jgi:hypothetical protein
VIPGEIVTCSRPTRTKIGYSHVQKLRRDQKHAQRGF